MTKTDLRLEPPPSTLPPGSTVWWYLRDSGGPTQDRSVEQQRQIMEEYCAKWGLVLTHPPFEDIHKSGTTTHNRNDFDYMMSLSASERQRPKGLLIWNHARFTRGGAYDGQFYKATLRKRGIIIHSLTDKIPEGKFAPVIESLIDTANQAKAEEASMGAWRGLRYLVKQGAVPGTPPRGFRRIPIKVKSEQGIERTAHRWDPDPKFEHRILNAFQMRAAGRSIKQIHRAVHLFGRVSTYTDFFQNLIYIGTLKRGDLIIEDYCRPIVPREIWDKVQEIHIFHAKRVQTKSGENHPRRVASAYILSGMIICARCGAPLNGLTSRQRNGELYRRYRCQNVQMKMECTAQPIPAAPLESLILKELHHFFEEETNLINLLSLFSHDQAQHLAAADAAIASLRAELGETRKKLTNTANAIASLGGSAALLKTLTALELEESDLTRRIAQIETQKTLPLKVPSKAEAKSVAAQILTRLQSDDPIQVRQTLLGMLYQVKVDRQGKHLLAQLDLYFDKKKDNVSTSPHSVGAPIYRHILEITYNIDNPGRKKTA